MTRSLAPFATRLPRGWDDLEREMGGMMKRMFDWDENGGELGFAPHLNIAETGTGYEVSVDLPGMKPEEVSVEFKDGDLWIAGERKSETAEEGKTFHRVERRYGSFRRVLRLGTDINAESINANYANGVLTITAEKTPTAVPKKIEVHA